MVSCLDSCQLHLSVSSPDASMKVSLPILQRVYEALQDQGSGDPAETELLDPESHLYVLDAFEMPAWSWSHERGTFERYAFPNDLSSTTVMSKDPRSRPPCLAQQSHASLPRATGFISLSKTYYATNTFRLPRYPLAIGNISSRYGQGGDIRRDVFQQILRQLKSTKQLLGRAGERFLLLGMLAHNMEGKLCLEDAEGDVVLDVSKLV